jgi:predicted phosphodiesterase
MTTPKEIVRVAALGDLHYPKIPQEVLQGLLTQATEQADVLLLCGDLTDYGQPDEAQRLAQACITYAKIPTLGVLGNHDYQSGQHEEVWKILCDAGIIMLDGDACEIHGIGFAGVKGFGGALASGRCSPGARQSPSSLSTRQSTRRWS